MFDNDTRSKLENNIKGIIIEGEEDNCTATRNFLCPSFSTSTTVKKDFEGKSIIKEGQVKFLKHYSAKNNLWVTDLPDDSTFLAIGGEAKVNFNSDKKSVIKLNDAI